jgi:DNA-binding GntR family transcriptional regulator
MFTLVRHYEPMGDHEEVDRESPVAAYLQIAGFLRGRIERGEYRPGQRLPSIADLVQTYGVARLTANKALRKLVADGLAEISPGMGVYVTGHRDTPASGQ